MRSRRTRSYKCFATQPFKHGGPDPQDCILFLEELLSVIEANTLNDRQAHSDHKRPMHCAMLAAGSSHEAMQAIREYSDISTDASYGYDSQQSDVESQYSSYDEEDPLLSAMFAKGKGGKGGKGSKGTGGHVDRRDQICCYFESGVHCEYGKDCKFKHECLLNEDGFRPSIMVRQ